MMQGSRSRDTIIKAIPSMNDTLGFQQRPCQALLRRGKCLREGLEHRTVSGMDVGRNGVDLF